MSSSDACLATVVLDHEEWVTVWRNEDGSLGVTVFIDGTAGFTLRCSPEHAAILAGGLLGVRTPELNAAPDELASVVLHGGEWVAVARSGDGYPHADHRHPSGTTSLFRLQKPTPVDCAARTVPPREGSGRRAS